MLLFAPDSFRLVKPIAPDSLLSGQAALLTSVASHSRRPLSPQTVFTGSLLSAPTNPRDIAAPPGFGWSHNSSFKPTPHRGVNSMLYATLHAVAAPLRVGLTQALGPMDVSQFSELEQTAMRKVIAYYILAWDWECPTLFGLEKNDLLAVLDDWPSHMKGGVEITIFSAAGALREYLYGASAVTAHKAKVETGLSQADLSLILHRLPPQK